MQDKDGNVLDFAAPKKPVQSSLQTASTANIPKPVIQDSNAGQKMREAALERIKTQSASKSTAEEEKTKLESTESSDAGQPTISPSDEQKLKEELEAKLRIEVEQKAKFDAEVNDRLAAEEKATAEDKEKAEAAEKARTEAEEKSKQEATERTKREAEEKEQLEQSEQAKKIAEDEAVKISKDASPAEIETDCKDAVTSTSLADAVAKESNTANANGVVQTQPTTSVKRIVITKDALLRYVLSYRHVMILSV